MLAPRPIMLTLVKRFPCERRGPHQGAKLSNRDKTRTRASYTSRLKNLTIVGRLRGEAPFACTMSTKTSRSSAGLTCVGCVVSCTFQDKALGRTTVRPNGVLTSAPESGSRDESTVFSERDKHSVSERDASAVPKPCRRLAQGNRRVGLLVRSW